jgi:hypothetical protein
LHWQEKGKAGGEGGKGKEKQRKQEALQRERRLKDMYS